MPAFRSIMFWRREELCNRITCGSKGNLLDKAHDRVEIESVELRTRSGSCVHDVGTEHAKRERVPRLGRREVLADKDVAFVVEARTAAVPGEESAAAGAGGAAAAAWPETEGVVSAGARRSWRSNSRRWTRCWRRPARSSGPRVGCLRRTRNGPRRDRRALPRQDRRARPRTAAGVGRGTVLAAAATRMTDRGARIACALGVRAATLRRWLTRLAEGRPLDRRRQRRRAAVPPELEASVRHVRLFGGLVGAASLARSIGGISRRGAAAIKRDELTVLERERQARCGHVRVAVPGVVRGFDAIAPRPQVRPGCLRCLRVIPDDGGRRRGLRCSQCGHDARGGLRTPPLVLRFDRARCHDAPLVASVLRAHRVIPLHGPATSPAIPRSARATESRASHVAVQNALNTSGAVPHLDGRLQPRPRRS
jgi:hypothetical protein